MTDQPQPLDLDAIRARHDDPESCADTVAMLAALDARNAEIRRLTTELEKARQRTETLAGIVALHLHTGWHLPKRTAEEKTRAKWAAGESNALAAALHAAEINVFADHNPAAVSGA